MLDPENPRHIARLNADIDASRQKLEPFREGHRQAHEQIIGCYYSEDSPTKAVPVNLMELARTVLMSQLVSNPPRAKVFTSERSYRAVGNKLQSVINRELESFGVHRELRRCVSNSLISIGILKVCAKPEGSYEYHGLEFDNNVPYVKNILLENWVHDMSVDTIDEVRFLGHQYFMDFEEAREDPTFDPEVRKTLRPMESEFGGVERMNELSGPIGTESEAYKRVACWEIYLPKERLMVTLTGDRKSKPLKVVEWDGPKRGPFHMLYFAEVDGNTMPLAPAMLWRPLHDAVNQMFRKFVRQADRQKTIGLALGQDSEDAKTMMDTPDGGVGGVANPSAVTEVSFGGMNQQNFAFYMEARQLFSYLNGNIDIMGGSGPQSETLGQDQMLERNSNRRMQWMQDEVILFTKRVLEDFGYYLWRDPLKVYQATVEIDGLDPIETALYPEERMSHDYYRHMIDVNPHSMQFFSPGQRMAMIDDVMMNTIMPAMQALAAQGIQVDFAKWLKLKAEYANLPELNEILIAMGQPIDQVGESRQSPVTVRTNERVNRSPGMSREGGEQATIQSLLRQGEGSGGQSA